MAILRENIKQTSLGSWTKLSIGSLGRVITGKTPSTKCPELFGKVYPFITPTDINDSSCYVKTERYLSEAGKEKQKNLLLPKGAICFTCIGATIGKICLTDNASFTNQQINSIVVDQSKHDNRFVYYLLKEITPKIRAKASGAATPIINKSSFSEVEVLTPPLPTQQKIAAILSAYDDLIENNTRRIAILEAMAQALYREWFVHFRYPGHGEVPLVDSPLGPIPQGWEVKQLEKVLEVIKGKSYKSSELVDSGGLPFVNLKCINREGGFRIDGLKNFEGKYKESHLVLPGDIVMAVTDMTQERRIIARPALIPKIQGLDKAVFSMDLVKIASLPQSENYFIYGLLRYSDFSEKVKEFANGANVLHLSPRHISEYTAVIPTLDLQKHFTTLFEPLIHSMDNISRRNNNLRQTRDLLLPRLISGQLDVSELEIESV